jgi:protein ImuA
LADKILHGHGKAKPLPFTLPELDDHLPMAGLSREALHEMIEAGMASDFTGSPTLFTVGIAVRLKGPVL